MRQRLVRRMGVLLASGRPLEALVLELHQVGWGWAPLCRRRQK